MATKQNNGAPTRVTNRAYYEASSQLQKAFQSCLTSVGCNSLIPKSYRPSLDNYVCTELMKKENYTLLGKYHASQYLDLSSMYAPVNYAGGESVTETRLLNKDSKIKLTSSETKELNSLVEQWKNDADKPNKQQLAKQKLEGILNEQQLVVANCSTLEELTNSVANAVALIENAVTEIKKDKM